jgi:hypothetical protein
MPLDLDRRRLQKIQLLVLDRDYSTAQTQLDALINDYPLSEAMPRLITVREALAGGYPEAARDTLAALLFATTGARPRRGRGRSLTRSPRLLMLLTAVLLAAVSLAAYALYERERTSYDTKDFGAAAKALGIEPVKEWKGVDAGEVTLRLPQRLSPAIPVDFTDPAQLNALGDVLGGVGTRYATSEILEQIKFGVFATDNQSSRDEWRELEVFAFSKSLGGTLEDFPSRQALQEIITGESTRQLDRTTLKMNGQPVIRLIIEVKQYESPALRAVEYVIETPTYFWTVIGITGADEFDNWLPVFEQIALSLKVKFEGTAF